MGYSDNGSTFIALGLSGDHLVELSADPALLARLDDAPLAFSVVGIDRIDGSAPQSPTLDSSAATTSLASRAGRSAFLVAAAPHRDHPYNLARRVTSLGLLSHERTGLILGIVDSFAPAGPAGRESWGGAALSAGAPLGPVTTRDAAIVVQKLVQSWPYDSIIADRESGIYVQADRIVHVDHNGVFAVAGPLNAPSPAGGSPVTAWYADSAEAVAEAADVVDLVVLASSDRIQIAAAAQALAATDGSHFTDRSQRALLFVEIGYVDGQHASEIEKLIGTVSAQQGVDGILLRPEHDTHSLIELLDTVIGELDGAGLVRDPGSGPLRERLSLPKAADLLGGARPAFAVPEPQPAL